MKADVFDLKSREEVEVFLTNYDAEHLNWKIEENGSAVLKGVFPKAPGIAKNCLRRRRRRCHCRRLRRRRCRRKRADDALVAGWAVRSHAALASPRPREFAPVERVRAPQQPLAAQVPNLRVEHHLVAARVALVHVKVVVAKFSSARIALLEKRWGASASLRNFCKSTNVFFPFPSSTKPCLPG